MILIHFDIYYYDIDYVFQYQLSVINQLNYRYIQHYYLIPDI